MTQRPSGHNGNADRVFYLNNIVLSHVRPLDFCSKRYYSITNTVPSVITCLSAKRIGSSTIDK